MTGPAIIRAACVATALLIAGPAQAGGDVPPPRAIKPIESQLWRATPPVLRGWSSDRHVSVIAAFDPTAASAAEEGADGGEDFAEAGVFRDNGYVSDWEAMR